MTDERLKELEWLCETATEGPWVGQMSARGDISVVSTLPVASVPHLRDATFIVEARTALPELIAEVRALRSQCKRTAEAIRVRHIDDSWPAMGYVAKRLERLSTGEPCP